VSAWISEGGVADREAPMSARMQGRLARTERSKWAEKAVSAQTQVWLLLFLFYISYFLSICIVLSFPIHIKIQLRIYVQMLQSKTFV
jgi:hypothetical protein